VLLSI